MSSTYLTPESGNNFDLYCRNLYYKGNINPPPAYPEDIVYNTLTQKNGTSSVDVDGNTIINNLQANDIGAQGDISAANDVIVGNILNTDYIENRASATLSITGGDSSSTTPGDLRLVATNGPTTTNGASVSILADGGTILPGTVTLTAEPGGADPNTYGKIIMKSSYIEMENTMGNTVLRILHGTNLTRIGTNFSGYSLYLDANKSVILNAPSILSLRSIINIGVTEPTIATTPGSSSTNFTLDAAGILTTIRCLNSDGATARTLILILPNASDLEAYILSTMSPGASIPIGANFETPVVNVTPFATGTATRSLTIAVQSSADGTFYAYSTVSSDKMSFKLLIAKVQNLNPSMVSYTCSLA